MSAPDPADLGRFVLQDDDDPIIALVEGRISVEECVALVLDAPVSPRRPIVGGLPGDYRLGTYRELFRRRAAPWLERMEMLERGELPPPLTYEEARDIAAAFLDPDIEVGGAK